VISDQLGDVLMRYYTAPDKKELKGSINLSDVIEIIDVRGAQLIIPSFLCFSYCACAFGARFRLPFFGVCLRRQTVLFGMCVTRAPFLPGKYRSCDDCDNARRWRDLACARASWRRSAVGGPSSRRTAGRSASASTS